MRRINTTVRGVLVPLSCLAVFAVTAQAQLVVNENLGILPNGVTTISGDTANGADNATIYQFSNPVANWGNELVYQFELTNGASLDVTLVEQTGGTDVDIILLSGLETEVNRTNDKNQALFDINSLFLDDTLPQTGTFGSLSPGTYYLSVDSFIGFDGGIVDQTTVFEYELDVSALDTIDPVADGFIRIDTQGESQSPTNSATEPNVGENYWGIEYGAGLGGQPAIESVVIDMIDARGKSFNPDEEDGGFVTPTLNGVAAPTATFSNPEEDFHLEYGKMQLDFAAGDFVPGDSIRFGVYVAAPFLDGGLMQQLDPQVQITINFDDGTSISGLLSERGFDGDTGLPMSYVDLEVAAATGGAGGTVPEPATLGLVFVGLIGALFVGRRRVKMVLGVCLAGSLTANSAFAVVQDTWTPFVLPAVSDGLLGDGNNQLEFFTTSTGTGYILGDVHFSGLATPLPPENEPSNPTNVTTYGSEMAVRMTHDRTDTSLDMALGRGANWLGQREFFGTAPHFAGLEIQTGDTFTFEFYEIWDDNDDWPDAQWDELVFEFTDDNDTVPAVTPAVADGFIRVDARGYDTFGTYLGGNRDVDRPDLPASPGYGFWGIEYGGDPSGTLPGIESLVIDLGDPDVMSWDAFSFNGEFTLDGDSSSGVAEEDIEPDWANPSSTFDDAFGQWILNFAPGTFTPGDIIRVGLDNDGGPGDGVNYKDLASPVEVTINFEGGESVSGLITEHGFVATAELQFSYGDIEVVFEQFNEADFDQDGDVDGDDFLLWQGGFGIQSGAEKMNGDYNNDGKVDGDDFLGWQANFGSGDGSSSGAVPEPSSIALVVFGLLAVLGARRR